MTPVTPQLTFSQVSAGRNHSCGVTTDHRIFCWGFSGLSNTPPVALGDGSSSGSLAPVAVGGALRFQQVSAGFSTTCAVTLDHRAYCWGVNDRGEVGDGSTTFRLRPVRVAGGHLFRQIETTFEHTCAVTYPDNRAYCWGWNVDGQLGDGTRTDRLKPVAVASALSFRQVTTGYDHSCGVTSDDRAFCWGKNKVGQLGDSTTVGRRVKPTLVARGLSFRQVDAGREFTCGTTVDDRAFCWGEGRSGQLGINRLAFMFWPRLVAGNLPFTRVSAGDFLTCGETRANLAYCWGLVFTGSGFFPQTLTPRAVPGGLKFAQVSASAGQACGKTPESVGYCWGAGLSGELGNGLTINSATPVPIGASTSVAVDGSVRDVSTVMDGATVQVLHVPSFEDRGIIEFRLSGITGAISNATLTLPVYATNGPYPFTVTALAYAGDGALTAEDWDRGVAFAFFGYGGEATVTLDVTAPVQALVSAHATVAGFNFRFTVPSVINQNGPFVAFKSLEYGPAAVLQVTTGP